MRRDDWRTLRMLKRLDFPALNTILGAPVFTYPAMDKMKWHDSLSPMLVDAHEIRLPFPTTGIHLDISDPNWSTTMDVYAFEIGVEGGIVDDDDPDAVAGDAYERAVSEQRGDRLYMVHVFQSIASAADGIAAPSALASPFPAAVYYIDSDYAPDSRRVVHHWVDKKGRPVIHQVLGASDDDEEGLSEAMETTTMWTIAALLRTSRLAARHHVAKAEPRETIRKAKVRFREPWLCSSLPRMVLLDEGERTDIMGNVVRGDDGEISDETGERVISRRAHRRRGHYRTLKAKRYGKRVGERVWVRPTWVGPREWAWGGVQYKVVSR